MAKRWSKLRVRLEALFDPRVRLQVHCAGFRDDFGYPGVHSGGRYWITLSREVIWDFPKGLVAQADYWDAANESKHKHLSPLWREMLEINALPQDLRLPYSASDVSGVIRDYIDTPVYGLPGKRFDNDTYGLTDILKAADRRVSRKRIARYFNTNARDAVKAVLAARGCQLPAPCV
jgi:hypothetical protein